MTGIPAHLGAHGRNLYAAAVTEFALSLPELAALLQASEVTDTLRVIKDKILDTGPVLETGKPALRG